MVSHIVMKRKKKKYQAKSQFVFFFFFSKSIRYTALKGLIKPITNNAIDLHLYHARKLLCSIAYVMMRITSMNAIEIQV